jgi:NitT/TauT family transport system permease protein
MSVIQRKIASAALIISFFLLWELICLALGISDLVLPRPSQIVSTLIEYWPAIAPQS